ncbi:hypothetical protein LX32DRAFT_221738 [Colletotrichum zoysiae]|uniref:Secreted protein n=1 Tax=Colletotrichum zoysiae TaxID=1216348 RepID=A0AAD9H513_9PEZI|nr:hypothetical protein LX32DRAFT_221738 [Colletotrichum zoysiae]
MEWFPIAYACLAFNVTMCCMCHDQCHLVDGRTAEDELLLCTGAIDTVIVAPWSRVDHIWLIHHATRFLHQALAIQTSSDGSSWEVKGFCQFVF